MLPTREWLGELCDFLDDAKARSVLEVAAGDGFLASCLARRRPDLNVKASDDNSWTVSQRRMTDADRAEFGSTPFAGIQPLPIVEKRGAVAAVNAHCPDIVIVAWAPPGTLVDCVIKGPATQLLLKLSVNGDGDVCGNGMETWRFEKDFLQGPIESRTLCRLDARPDVKRHTTATLYCGRGHGLYAVQRRTR